MIDQIKKLTEIELSDRSKLLGNQPECIPIILEGHKPEIVFQKLLDEMSDILKEYDVDKTVFDITGGKKSMVAGAYLFCAYADIDVSYVDFDDEAYVPQYGRPYGCGCRIGVLKNPYRLFGVQNWQRVEALYKRYAFRAAREQVEELIKEIKGLFSPCQINAAERLQQVIKVYEEWDRGDYCQAWRSALEISDFSPPSIITAMGKGNPPWPDTGADNFFKQVFILSDGIDGKFKNSLYTQARLVIYAKNEIEKASRSLINADYQSAFTIAYSTSEVLLKARLINELLNNHQIGITFINNRPTHFSSLSNEQKEVLVKSIRYTLGITKIVKFLRGGYSMKLFVRLRNDKLSVLIEELNHERLLNQTISDKFFQLNDLRNQLIHFCLWVPENYAKNCIDWAETNLKDYEENWLPAPEHNTTIANNATISHMDWKELLNFCGIDFLFPISRKTT